MDYQNYKHSELTDKINGCAVEVYRNLGYGFLESVYENALVFELTKRGLEIEVQKQLQVSYKGHIVGNFIADIIVDGKVLVELKAVSELLDTHFSQLYNYLRATDIEVGLLINFGPKLAIKRRIFDCCSAQPAAKTDAVSPVDDAE
jgi:GxxExxY protein